LRIPLVVPGVKGRSSELLAHERINLYPQLESPGSKNIASLVGTPGLTLFATSGGSPIRGMYRTTTGRMFVVGGTTLDEFDADGTKTNRGTIVKGWRDADSIINMVDDGVTMVIVTGGFVYSYVLATNTLAAIASINTIRSDNSYTAAEFIDWQDGYFIISFPNAQTYYISADGTTWNTTNSYDADAFPDNIQAHVSHLDKLWFFKEDNTEIHYNSGNADFPFELAQGAEFQIGIEAPHSLTKIGNSLFFLGRGKVGKGAAFMTQGYNPIRITDPNMEHIFQSFSDISDANGYAYQQEGHVFYELNFPTADQTWVYDITTKMWHRRGYLNNATNALERQRGRVYCHFNGKDYVGDYETGQIFELDLDTYTDNGQEIQRTWTSPNISQNEAKLFHSSFEAVFKKGVGLESGQGSDPQAMLQWSDNGGRTQSNEYWRDIGEGGNYGKRALWHRLGYSRNRVYRVMVSDPVETILIDAYVQVESE
jgi:hypothetical protein